MTCNGCRGHVEKTLSNVEGVTIAKVDLQMAEATIEMESHIPIETFEEALKNDGGKYHIHKQGHPIVEVKKDEKPKGKGTGTFYCPMHCEGEKMYDKAGDCPVCGMDLVEERSLSATSAQFTCPCLLYTSSGMWNGLGGRKIIICHKCKVYLPYAC